MNQDVYSAVINEIVLVAVTSSGELLVAHHGNGHYEVDLLVVIRNAMGEIQIASSNSSSADLAVAYSGEIAYYGIITEEDSFQMPICLVLMNVFTIFDSYTEAVTTKVLIHPASVHE